jgi:hypothetical protein
VSRMTGKFGAVYLGSTPTVVADVIDWQFEATTEVLNCDIKGDAYSKFSPSHASARFTAKRINQASAVFAALVADAAVNATQLLFRLDLVDASGSYTQITGQGFVTSGGIGAPRDKVEDVFEVTLDGLWSMS